MNELEQKIADAETTVAELETALAGVTKELAELDPTAGDIEKCVDSQLRLSAKQGILEKRLELTRGGLSELRGDLTLAKAEDLAKQVKAAAEELAAAQKTAGAAVLAMLHPGLSDSRQRGVIESVVPWLKEVRPLIDRHEYLTARSREAEGCCHAIRGSRAKIAAESTQALRKEIFANN